MGDRVLPVVMLPAARDDHGMTCIAAVLFGLAAAFELAGVGLIVREVVAARKLLRTPMVRGIDGGDPFTDYNIPVEENSDPVELFLLHGRSRQMLAVVFLFLGIMCGTVGNFLTLDW